MPTTPAHSRAEGGLNPPSRSLTPSWSEVMDKLYSRMPGPESSPLKLSDSNLAAEEEEEGEEEKEKASSEVRKMDSETATAETGPALTAAEGVTRGREDTGAGSSGWRTYKAEINALDDSEGVIGSHPPSATSSKNTSSGHGHGGSWPADRTKEVGHGLGLMAPVSLADLRFGSLSVHLDLCTLKEEHLTQGQAQAQEGTAGLMGHLPAVPAAAGSDPRGPASVVPAPVDGWSSPVRWWWAEHAAAVLPPPGAAPGASAGGWLGQAGARPAVLHELVLKVDGVHVR